MRGSHMDVPVFALQIRAIADPTAGPVSLLRVQLACIGPEAKDSLLAFSTRYTRESRTRHA